VLHGVGIYTTFRVLIKDQSASATAKSIIKWMGEMTYDYKNFLLIDSASFAIMTCKIGRGVQPVQRVTCFDAVTESARGGHTMGIQGPQRRLESKAVGALPIVSHFLKAIGFEDVVEHFVPTRRRRGRPWKLAPARTLSVLLGNLVVNRLALYRVPDWVNGHVPELFNLTAEEATSLTDERLANALDLLYEADRRSLVTELTRRAVRAFRVELKEIHNDTTTVTFFGKYEGQDSLGTVLLCRGFNKDHRPDLKQLVFSVCASADGDIPIHHGLFDGNTTDDQVHCHIWNDLRAFVGHSDFIYVADSKLCTRANMFHIDSGQGKFITVLPRSRKEDGDFRDWVQENEVAWNEEKKLNNPRDVDGPPHIFKVHEAASRSSEGYRIVWVWDSLKSAHDALTRKERIDDTVKALSALQPRLGARSLKTKSQVQAAVDKILIEHKAAPYITVHVEVQEMKQYRQARRGRPGPTTPYVKLQSEMVSLSWTENTGYIRWESKTDGLFPLITNIELDGSTHPKDRSAGDKAAVSPDDPFRPMRVLEIYKGQPNIEKLHSMLKSFIQAMPVWLKKVRRVEALLCLMYIALLVSALIQRQMRRQMQSRGISSLPLYPDEKECRRPTTRTIFDLYEPQRRHRLFVDKDLQQTFCDGLSSLQSHVLEILGVDPRPYGKVQTTPPGVEHGDNRRSRQRSPSSASAK
jgi:transposase